MAKLSLNGKRIVLTGASSGIGWHLAGQLIAQGAAVLATGRREERLSQLGHSLEFPRKLLVQAGDLCDPAHRQALIDKAVAEFGGIDILINNAGVGAIGPFEQATQERLRCVFEVDFFAAVELTRLAIPQLKLGVQPTICLVNSVLGYRGVPGKSEYCAAKFALRGWSESLRVELKPIGIDVISVFPSTTDSEFFQSLVDTKPGIASRSLGSQSPQRVAGSIVRALKQRRCETVLSPGGKLLVWVSRFAPRLTDFLLLKFGR